MSPMLKSAHLSSLVTVWISWISLLSSRSTHHQGPDTMLLSMCHLQTPRSKARRRLAWHFLFAPGPDLLPLVFMTVALARDGLWVPDESTSGSLSASISRTCWLFWTDNIWRSGSCCHNQNKPWWSLRVVATLSPLPLSPSPAPLMGHSAARWPNIPHEKQAPFPFPLLSRPTRHTLPSSSVSWFWS